MKNVLRFTTILFAVITLSALMTHLLEFRGKINLSKGNYQVVQSIYRGWAWLGIFEVGAILLTLIWTITNRKNKNIFILLLSALICFTISLIIFFIFTFPANQAAVNWTQLPQQWEPLRMKWEYSHAIRAVLNLIGFSFLIVCLIKSGESEIVSG
ncbi:MAG: hypothetical protein WKG06_35175 [Segetibacter sp.]